MAITVRDVQNCQGAGAGGALSVLAMGAFASNPINGDSIIVAQSEYNTAAAAQAPTDSQSNIYAQIGSTIKQSVFNANTGMSFWIASNIVGGSSFVVSAHHANNNHCAVAWCITGAGLTPYNGDWVEGHGAGATNPVSGPTVISPIANSLMIACLFQDDSVSATPAAGWNTTGVNGFDAGMNTRSQVAFAGLPIRMCTAYKMVSATDSCTWTVIIPHAQVRMIASFFPGGGNVNAGAFFFAT